MKSPGAARSLRWVVNAGLLVASCLLGLRTAERFLEARAPLQREVRAPAEASLGLHPRPWSDREVIVERNVFDASLLVPAKPRLPPAEEIEDTKLPLGLLGTISSPESDLGFAAIWDAGGRRSLALAPGDEVGDGLATVMQIERERVLLSEKGELRELELNEDGQYRPAKRPARRRLRRASALRRQQRGRR